MSRNRRNQHRTWLPMAAVLALVLAGCGADASSNGAAFDPTEGGPNGDAGFGGAGGGTGMPTGGLGGVQDRFLADPQRNPSDFLGLATDAESAAGYADAARTCYASADACSASACGAFASCCVNTGACCEPIVEDPPLPAMLDFQKCAGPPVLTVEACAQGEGSTAVTFGEDAPVINARGLVPNGTATSEGGAIIGDLVNLSAQRVDLDVRFTLPVGCNGTCLQSAGVAFTASAPGAFVDADVGLLLSGSREMVNLMIGNAVADSFDAGTSNTRWRLVLSPEGWARVLRDDDALGTYSFDAAALERAQLVAFGRNLGTASTSAAIAVLEVEASLCDSPRAWTDRQPVAVTLNGNEVPGHASGHGPSIVDQGVRQRVAYAVDGEIFVSEVESPGELVLSDLTPALVPTEPYEALGLADPELEWDGNSLFLFYTARDSRGMGSIGIAVSTQDPPSFTNAQSPIFFPPSDAVSYDAPSVLYRDGLWLLVVRATLSNGATELRAFYTSDLGTDWARVENGGLEQLTRVDSPTSEVTDPSLIVHNSAYHLYYARRTGTRWSVELAVSDELLLWRPLGDVLGDSDEEFDGLGARSPDAISQPDRIDIVYSGQDGVAFRLGTASRAAPSGTAPSFF